MEPSLTLDQEQLAAYLRRVGLAPELASAAPSLETLRGLHGAHTTAVPFESMSMHGYLQVRLSCHSSELLAQA